MIVSDRRAQSVPRRNGHIGQRDNDAIERGNDGQTVRPRAGCLISRRVRGGPRSHQAAALIDLRNPAEDLVSSGPCD